MSSVQSWFKDRLHLQDGGLNFDAHINMQTRKLLVTYLYKQSLVGQVASLFCAAILFAGVYHSNNSLAVLAGWFIYSCIVAAFRIIIASFYTKNSSVDKNIQTWKIVFAVGAFAGGLAWGIAGSFIFWNASHIQQTLIVLIIAGVTSGAIPILAADLVAAILFLSAALVPLIVQLFFQQQTYVYSLFSLTVSAYFIYMLILTFRSYHLLSQTIGLQFEKEALTSYLKEANEKLAMMQVALGDVETHDISTGLANRRLFMLTLKEAIKRAEISQKNFAVLYIDMDNFKFINDAYSYEVGDKLLQMVIRRIKENLREMDMLARIAGDEFAILLENQSSTTTISHIAKQVCQLMAKPFHVGDHHITISVSIGVSVYPLDGVTAEVLIKKADKAMQYIKEHGHNNFHFNTGSSGSSD